MSKKDVKVNKREKFVKNKKKSKSNSRSRRWKSVGIVLAALVVVGGLVYLLVRSPKSSSDSTSSKAAKGNSSIVEMTNIQPTIENGKIVVSFDEIERDRLVSFSYEGALLELGPEKIPVPLLAYITPGGKLITAVSMCEPCRSTRFHIDKDNTLTCNACGTKWDPETLEGVYGACTDFPPDEVQNTREGDRVLIDESEVSSWRPRV